MIAFLSDVHANLQALEACLAQAEAKGARRYVFMGDIIGYGADPCAVLDRIMPLCEAGGVCVLGNHDLLTGDPFHEMAAHAAEAAVWTRQQLAPRHRAFLERLPLTVEEDDRLYVHADASAPASWRYVVDAQAAKRSLDAASQRVVFCGHVHVPMLHAQAPDGRMTSFSPQTGKSAPLLSQRKWHVVLGSVGQPRDKDPSASFALYDPATREIVFHRAAYDAQAAAKRILDAGLPSLLASRLMKGR